MPYYHYMGIISSMMARTVVMNWGFITTVLVIMLLIIPLNSVKFNFELMFGSSNGIVLLKRSLKHLMSTIQIEHIPLTDHRSYKYIHTLITESVVHTLNCAAYCRYIAW